MKKIVLWIGLAFVLACSLRVNAQYAKQDSTHKKYFVGSTLFMLGNLAPVNPPNFVQLNLGYRITGKDVISLELITWKYAWPLGINPFLNKSYGKPEEKFPGYIRDYGIGVAYQRFFWKGLYAAVHVMPMWQTFVNDNGNKVDNGFQIFTRIELAITLDSLRIGFLYNPRLVLPVVLITLKCPMGLNKKMTSGQNTRLSQGCISGLIFN